MKKQWLPLVFAVFLMLAPIASAGDGSVSGSLEEVIDQIVAWLADELGLGYPPHGADQPELGLLYPPYGAAQPGDQQGIGELYPPYGAVQPGDQPELGLEYPPHG